MSVAIMLGCALAVDKPPRLDSAADARMIHLVPLSNLVSSTAIGTFCATAALMLFQSEMIHLGQLSSSDP